VNGPILNEQSGQYSEIFTDTQTRLISGLGPKKQRVPFYSGTGIFEPTAFLGVPPGVSTDFVSQVLVPAIQKKQVGYVFSDALWIDIGSPALWHHAQKRLESASNLSQLPEVLLRAIKSADRGYGGRFVLGKSSIQLDDLKYEITDLRNF